MGVSGQSFSRRRAPVALLLLLSVDVLAAAEGQVVEAQAGTVREGATSLFNAAYVFQVLGSLVLVFACIFALIFLLRKLNGLPLSGGAPIRVLASARVGSREKIVLLEAGDQQLLVGVAAGSVRALHVFEEPIAVDSAASAKTADFGSLLRSAASGREAT